MTVHYTSLEMAYLHDELAAENRPDNEPIDLGQVQIMNKYRPCEQDHPTIGEQKPDKATTDLAALIDVLLKIGLQLVTALDVLMFLQYLLKAACSLKR